MSLPDLFASVSFSPDEIPYLTRIIFAAILGGLVGLERDIHGRAAGLRTHLLVCTGAAVFMVLSVIIAAEGKKLVPGITFISDPGRIAAQVVTGIGFLGAGTIIKAGINVRGLTTAACLWIVASIGMAAGAGLYLIASVTTLLALFSLISLHHLEKLYPKDSYRALTLTTSNTVETSRIIESINSRDVQIIHIELERDYETELTTTRLFIRLFHKGLTDRLCHGIISSLEQANISLKKIKWDHKG